MSLSIISTHPIQYHAPVYRALEAKFGIPVNVIYGSDFSVKGYRDPEFKTKLAWDTDLLSGYSPIFLSRVSKGGARNAAEVTSRGLGKTLKQLSPKAVLVLGYGSGFHVAAFYEARRANLPIIFRGETTDYAKKRGIFKAFIRDRILRFIYKRCGKLLYVGQNSYKHFKRLGCPEEKLIFSPYCVNAGQFRLGDAAHTEMRHKMRQSLKIPEDQITLIFSGKLVHRKGPDLLLNAVRMMPPDLRSRVTLIFLGSGQLEKELRMLSGKSPSVKSVFAGFQNQSQLSDYYHAADLLVLPSRHSETWGLVVNEALHHGLPCIVSDAVGCAPDLIEEGLTGEIFRTGSAASLAEAVKKGLRLISDSATPEKCRKKVNNYTVFTAAEGIARAYKAVTERQL